MRGIASRKMFRIYHGDEISHTANDLRSVIRQCIKQWQPKIAAKHGSLTVDLNAALPVLCQAEDTETLINSLFELTINRLPDGGELSVVGCRTAGVVELEIADSGSILACDVRYDRLTFPTRTVVNDRQLTILQTLALSFGGRIWAAPCPQGGMAWTLRLPARVSNKRAA